MVAEPLVADRSPVNILKVVVLPAPFTPSNPKHSPVDIAILIPLTAFLPGKQQGIIPRYT